MAMGPVPYVIYGTSSGMWETSLSALLITDYFSGLAVSMEATEKCERGSVSDCSGSGAY